jgi:hypothetical protein
MRTPLVNPGDDVTVHYEDKDHAGVVISAHHGWILTRIAVDPAWDYGAVGPRLAAQPLIMARTAHVTPREAT